MFHTPNRKERYSLTVNPEMAKRAFSSEQAFRRFLDMQIKELFDANIFVNTLEYFFTEVDK